jgi:hypothetical protein
VVVINRNWWSPSTGFTGRHAPERAAWPMFRVILKNVSVNRLQMLGVEIPLDRVKAKLKNTERDLIGLALLARFLFREPRALIVDGHGV